MSRGTSLSLVAFLALDLLAPQRAQAFCGFFVAGGDAKLINNASQVVLMRKGNRTVMTMSNNYQGPPEDFAMVVPVPVVLKKEDVKTLPMDVFDRVDSLSAPRLVEYWELDPCRPPEPMYESLARAMPAPAAAPARKAKANDLGVTIEARFTAGEYEVLILSAKESSGLETWLRLNKYRIPEGAAAALAPYVRDKSKFFVAKVDSKKVKRDAQGAVQLSPLRFAFDSNELRLPVRLGLLNANGKQDLIVYVIHPDTRFEVANYANAFIPTNLEVADQVRQSFGSFYAELFDATIDRLAGKAVVTEYAWQTTGCDPCPVPPLTPSDLATLGMDVIEPGSVVVPSKPGAPNPPRVAPRPFFGGGASWVLTRLHTRYSKQTLSEDLVFRQAPPVRGGRAKRDGTSGDAGASVEMDGTNNFQGRYIIRHYWTGPVKCKDPRYNAWGGPPGNESGQQAPTAAKGLAQAPRGKVALRGVVRSPVPLLGIPASPPPRRPAGR
jgi:hypothetical protein